MITDTVKNNILNALYCKSGSGIVSGSVGKCYLGFSTTSPTINDSGELTFTEPTKSTGYKRLEAVMEDADGGSITNGSENLTWPAPNEGQQYGQATHLGLFTSKENGTPYATIELTAPVTLGVKSTLILYKGKLTSTLTETNSSST